MEVKAWLMIGVGMMFLLALVIVLVAQVSGKRILKEEHKLSVAQVRHQKELLNNSIAIQETERERIAADLHDELVGKLNVIRLLVYDQQEAGTTEKPNALGLLDESISIARGISHELYPPMLDDFGLVDALRDVLYPLQHHVEIGFQVIGPQITGRLGREEELHLYRATVEAINNVMKHANCNRIEVDVRITAQLAVIRIKDNGVGFDHTKKRKGMGLKNLESRIQMIGGKYRIKSSSDSGTTVLFILNRK